jgi:protein-tyrosine phosphatase
MDWLKEKVSGEAVRYKKDGYNLDITYITDRVLAMSFPASGLEQYYRNNIKKVVNFLDEKHGSRYKIYNLSNKEYNFDKFKGFVKSWSWEDHHAVPLLTLFELWQNMYDFLQEKDNVIVVHWKAGRGRTGTLIAWFLIYAGLAKNSEEAIKYFGRKRIKSGLGVTQPCQIRWVRYFELIYKGIIKSPCIRILDEVRIKSIPHMNGKSCKPYMEIINLNKMKMIYNGKTCDYIKTFKCLCSKGDPQLVKSKTSKPSEEFGSMEPSGIQSFSTDHRDYSFKDDHIDDQYFTVIDEVTDTNSEFSDTPQLFKNFEEFKKNKLTKLEEEEIRIDSLEDSSSDILLPHRKNQPLIGDTLIRIMHKSVSGKQIWRLYFNTAFIFTHR